MGQRRLEFVLKASSLVRTTISTSNIVVVSVELDMLEEKDNKRLTPLAMCAHVISFNVIVVRYKMATA